MTAKKSGSVVSLMAPGAIDDGFRSEWRSLDQEPFTPNPYFSAWFLEPAMLRLAPGDAVRLCVIRRAEDGLLIGLMPVVTGGTYAKIPLKHFTVWKYDHGYNGAPLIRQGFAQDVYGALIDWIDTRPEGARFLRFIDHPLSQLVEAEISVTCAARGRSYLVQSRQSRAVLTGGQEADAILARAYRGKKRKELRRQARRFKEIGVVRFIRITRAGEISAAVNQFVELELSGWKGRRDDAFPIGGSDSERGFFDAAIRNGAREGAVICDALMLDEQPVAMLFSMRSGNGLAAFKIAYDETYAAYSPGVRLMAEATRQMLGDPSIALFDSCARAGHPLADRLWRERMDVVQFNIPAAGAVNVMLLRFCARLEKAKHALWNWRNKLQGAPV